MIELDGLSLTVDNLMRIGRGEFRVKVNNATVDFECSMYMYVYVYTYMHKKL